MPPGDHRGDNHHLRPGVTEAEHHFQHLVGQQAERHGDSGRSVNGGAAAVVAWGGNAPLLAAIAGTPHCHGCDQPRNRHRVAVSVVRACVRLATSAAVVLKGVAVFGGGGRLVGHVAADQSVLMSSSCQVA